MRSVQPKQISTSHLQQSDSYYQNLTTHLDNQMRGIAVLIAEKKELEIQNGKLLAGVKSIGQEVNDQKHRLRLDHRELGLAFERKGLLEKEIK